MAITTPVYTTREAVKEALDFKETARNNKRIDSVIQAGARSVEGRLHRRFYPEIATRKFDWPSFQYAPTWQLWLGDNELISATTVTAGGVVIPSTDYILRRGDDKTEPPFNRVEINLATNSAFAAGNTHQQAIVILGLYGYTDDSAPAGTITANISASVTSVNVSDSGIIGVGSIIKIGTERLFVTNKSMLDSAQNTTSALTASKNEETIPVGSGAAFNIDEVILIDAERMQIVDIAGNNLLVKRAWDGSTLAAHSINADVFAPRSLTVTRGVLGTTAAAHTNADAITKHVAPSLVSEYNLALALNDLSQGQSAWAKEIGSGENAREATGRGLSQIINEAITAYGRNGRLEAV